MAGFIPAWWLRNPHLQSILASLALRRRGVERRAAPLLNAGVQHILDCGDGVRLMGWYSAQPRAVRQLVVVLHGWEGSADSPYILSLSQFLFERGFDIFRLNLRDHGPTHHLNRDLFHSCRLNEVIGAVQRLQTVFADRTLSLVGFSLGGNFALRIGARAAAGGLSLRRIVAVSPVLDPEQTLRALETGLPLYRRYFIRKWTRSLHVKQRAWPEHYDFTDLLRRPTLTDMTERLVLQHTDFPTLRHYLCGYALVGDTLQGLTVSSRIITAADDPIIAAADLERLARPPALRITRTRHGGHCGFMESPRGGQWLANEILSELDSELDNK